MSGILILGAGRSSSSLISYLQQQAIRRQWQFTVGDYSLEAATERLAPSGYGTAMRFDIQDEAISAAAIAKAEVVVSLMPAHLHLLVAQHCLRQGKHLLTASYITPEMSALDAEARDRNLLFLNECGLDPGIDHMSAMQLIDSIRDRGGKLLSFESFTGGLIAPHTAPDNPWRYKFTWNPRNVVMAGQSTAKYLLDGRYQYIPYHQLFRRITPVTVEGVAYEGYANRDSLKYREVYGLNDIRTMLRGTLRYQGFCSAWNVLVQLGCCDDSYEMELVDTMTHRQFMESFVTHQHRSIEEAICDTLRLQSAGEEMKRLTWSGLFSNDLVGLKSGSPARILEHILLKKWTLDRDDKDFVVMWHRFVYEHQGRKHTVHAHLTSTGSNAIETAMARTVGLPLGIAASLLMEGKIKTRGVAIPVSRDIYVPVLQELKALGIELVEEEVV
ncbi:saccharopine dehydrogenase C-terminal domain-containing protein [Chryseolinea sp. T2]|uniref:saccharopine dehydrogenase C-terminal domain-containing protein n=1 Tax=Chryseolinea sp. T2 TaxID=3129255 RepID=UPI003077FF22